MRPVKKWTKIKSCQLVSFFNIQVPSQFTFQTTIYHLKYTLNEIYKSKMLLRKIMITTKLKEKLLAKINHSTSSRLVYSGKEIEFHVFLLAPQISSCLMMVYFQSTHIIKIQFSCHLSNKEPSPPKAGKTVFGSNLLTTLVAMKKRRRKNGR